LSNLTFEHKTFVFLANIDQEVNLEALIISIGLERAESEPEQCPGLVFRSGVVDATLLMFSTGRSSLTGLRIQRRHCGVYVRSKLLLCEVLI
jgi:transcription initiation factor TFIID TATA-box-binding protein